ncbi:hypothetical protein [Streptomyces sp. NPDC006132]|uniref:hypothetical protein n=1 Tax=Streptomyces sp. NPDC006132 TaxID=3156732 RepID=UPI0033EAEADD
MTRPARVIQARFVAASAWLHHIGAPAPSQFSSVPVHAPCPVVATKHPPGRSHPAIFRSRGGCSGSGMWIRA